MADYIIINKTDLKKKLKDLQYDGNREPDNQMQSYLLGQVKSIEYVIENSIPLDGELTKAFNEGKSGKQYAYSTSYMKDLKLDL